MLTLFFSYSHRDEPLRNELEIHLAMLKRQGVIETWHDRRITAGREFVGEIDSNLETADIILLLASPDFIASDYCYDIEMKRALDRHEKGEARVIPVILRPCEWQQTPFGKLRATPTDGRPVSKFPDKDDAFLEISKDIRRVAEELTGRPRRDDDTIWQNWVSQSEESLKTRLIKTPRSSNLRVQRKYTDLERSRFLAETIEYLANFFENSLTELEKRSHGIQTEFKRIDANHFTAAVYEQGKLASSCKIWLGTDFHSSGEIRYSTSPSSYDNSYNESLNVADDGYALGLKSMGFHQMGQGKETFLTQEGGAELFWKMLIEPLQQR